VKKNEIENYIIKPDEKINVITEPDETPSRLKDKIKKTMLSSKPDNNFKC
jgi:hypothetical protein